VVRSWQNTSNREAADNRFDDLQIKDERRNGENAGYEVVWVKLHHDLHISQRDIHTIIAAATASGIKHCNWFMRQAPMPSRGEPLPLG
jgi:hypothetical protein